MKCKEREGKERKEQLTPDMRRSFGSLVGDCPFNPEVLAGDDGNGGARITVAPGAAAEVELLLTAGGRDAVKFCAEPRLEACWAFSASIEPESVLSIVLVCPATFDWCDDRFEFDTEFCENGKVLD